jgi:hypothetical protein
MDAKNMPTFSHHGSHVCAQFCILLTLSSQKIRQMAHSWDAISTSSLAARAAILALSALMLKHEA